MHPELDASSDSEHSVIWRPSEYLVDSARCAGFPGKARLIRETTSGGSGKVTMIGVGWKVAKLVSVTESSSYILHARWRAMACLLRITCDGPRSNTTQTGKIDIVLCVLGKVLCFPEHSHAADSLQDGQQLGRDPEHI